MKPADEQREINDVLADSLAHFMELRKESQLSLARSSGVSQATINNYLRPHARLESKSGKPPSAKLHEVGLLAKALKIKPWQLLQDMTPEQRVFYAKLESAFLALQEDVNK